MYEQQKPFRLDELVRISAFLNNLVFKMLWNEMVDGKNTMARGFDCYRPTKKEHEHSKSFPKIAGSVHFRARDSGRSVLLSQIELFPDKLFFLRQIALLVLALSQLLTFAVFLKLVSSYIRIFISLPTTCYSQRLFFSKPVLFVWRIFRNQRTDVEFYVHAVDDTVRQRL